VTVFLDTSVLVAAFWGDHADHAASPQLFAAMRPERGACGIHSLAEVYAVMMTLPVRPPLAPEQVQLFVEEIPKGWQPSFFNFLQQSDYLKTVRDLADRRLASGQIDDALLLACARKAKADKIYTWNVKHFRQLAPDLAARSRRLPLPVETVCHLTPPHRGIQA
jgi:predicted nucleic acid-binding protein